MSSEDGDGLCVDGIGWWQSAVGTAEVDCGSTAARTAEEEFCAPAAATGSAGVDPLSGASFGGSKRGQQPHPQVAGGANIKLGSVASDVIEKAKLPFAEAAELVKAIPGFSEVSASAAVAEIGAPMEQFASAGHLARGRVVSWR
jgi:hypothetical protein